MYNGGVGAGITATTTGATGVSLLPDTGSFRVMFFVAAVMLSIGVITLAITGATALRHSRKSA